MREDGPHFIVSNGDHTDTVADFQGVFHLNAILRDRVYEPDPPNFTQRITGVTFLAPIIQMSIIRKSVFGGEDECDRVLYEYIPHAGFGHCITTYSGDGKPLPAFRGDPLIMPLRGSIEKILESYWHALNEDNRVSLAVKFIERRRAISEIRIINKYEQKT